jgi:hypothetical protein
MGPIATTLLCYFEPQKVYAALVRLHDTYNMHAIFSPGFLGLLQAIYVQERTMESKMPDVYSSFKKHMISTASYTTKWTSLFSRIQSRSRRNFGYGMLIPSKDRISSSPWLWPSYGSVEARHSSFSSGPYSNVSYCLLHRSHHFRFPNFETALSLLSSFFVPEDDDALLSWIEQMLGDKAAIADRTVASGLGATLCIRSGWQCATIASLLFYLGFIFLVLLSF